MCLLGRKGGAFDSRLFYLFLSEMGVSATAGADPVRPIGKGGGPFLLVAWGVIYDF